MTLSIIWQEFLAIIKEEAGSRVVETWFKAVTLSHWDAASKVAYLKAPNNFVKDWISSNYQPLFKAHLGRLLNEKDIKLIFLDETKAEPSEKNMSENEHQPYAVISSHVASTTIAVSAKTTAVTKNSLSDKPRINLGYQFQTFVVGPNNSLAYAAAHAITEKPGILYNPLFIYGESGLGKTHLLHAIGHQIKIAYPKAKIIYQSADRFVNEFINAIRFDKVNNFESKYRDIDVLLIDDIQFISNKEQTQEAFFHIFNALYESRKQIVFTSDSMPHDIAGLADRLRSRLEGGLMTDIQAPTLETKIAILKKKADLHSEPINDEVAYFIASQVVSNVRELEGLLIRVLAFASLTQQQVSLELAQKILLRSSREPHKQVAIDLPRIAAKVAQHYSYSLQELRSTKRHKKVTLARHIAMYLMKKLTDSSLTDIALFWNRKDHSTVIHALEKIAHYTTTDATFGQDLQKLEQMVTYERFC